MYRTLKWNKGVGIKSYKNRPFTKTYLQRQFSGSNVGNFSNYHFQKTLSKNKCTIQKQKKKGISQFEDESILLCSLWDGNCRYTVVSCFHKPVFILAAFSELIKGTGCPFSFSVPPF